MYITAGDGPRKVSRCKDPGMGGCLVEGRLIAKSGQVMRLVSYAGDLSLQFGQGRISSRGVPCVWREVLKNHCECLREEITGQKQENLSEGWRDTQPGFT